MRFKHRLVARPLGFWPDYRSKFLFWINYLPVTNTKKKESYFKRCRMVFLLLQTPYGRALQYKYQMRVQQVHR